MKVKEIMQKRVLTLSPHAQLSEVARIIFSIGIGGVPIIDKKKIVGIVTEEDLLRRMFPSMKEIMEDRVRAKSFEAMEEKLTDMIHRPVSKVMNKDVVTIGPETNIMSAQSVMFLNSFSRLPVVDKRNHLLGIISQGDIFKHLVRKELPKIEQAKYTTFIGENYSDMVQWDKRFKYEFPALFYLFKSHGVSSVIDLGSWSGDYAIELARRGLHVLGVDNNDLMITICNEKRSNLPSDVRKNVSFRRVDYQNLASHVDTLRDGVVCMGNSFPYIYVPLDDLLAQVHKCVKKKGILVLQLLNFNKILKKKRAFLSFNVQVPKKDADSKKIHFEFIQQGKNGWIQHYVTGFDYQGDEWTFAGMNKVKAKNIDEKTITTALKKAGFKEVLVSGNEGEYQGEYGPLSLTDPFDELESDWMNVVAVK